MGFVHLVLGQQAKSASLTGDAGGLGQTLERYSSFCSTPHSIYSRSESHWWCGGLL